MRVGEQWNAKRMPFGGTLNKSFTGTSATTCSAGSAGAHTETGRPALWARLKFLAATFFVALFLAFGAAVTEGAVSSPAEARAANYCSHKTTVHWGGRRWHGMTFERHYWRYGAHFHVMEHWRRFGGKWYRNWTRTFRCIG